MAYYPQLEQQLRTAKASFNCFLVARLITRGPLLELRHHSHFVDLKVLWRGVFPFSFNRIQILNCLLLSNLKSIQILNCLL